ncbi:MAG: YceI family protein [Sphingobacteriaceae bacterium]|nr:YceI family protein [Cytophagaceae bacterium]
MAQFFNRFGLRACILVALWLVGIAATAQPTWRPSGSSVGFKAKQFGVEVDGTFKGLNATLRFDPANPATGSLAGNVDARTVDTGNKLRNKHLRERESFFNVEKFPVIRLKSTRLEKAGNGYAGTFELTIKDVTKSLRVPFTFETTGKTGVFAATFPLDRRDYDLGGSTLGMSDNVTVRITVTTQQE